MFRDETGEVNAALKSLAEGPEDRVMESDIIGPIDHVTWKKSRYVLTLLGTRSRLAKLYTWQILSKPMPRFNEYNAWLEMVTSTKIKLVHFSQAKEYVLFHDFLCQGITQTFCSGYKAQVNRLASKNNRMLFYKMTALLSGSGLENRS